MIVRILDTLSLGMMAVVMAVLVYAAAPAVLEGGPVVQPASSAMAERAERQVADPAAPAGQVVGSPAPDAVASQRW